MLRARVITALVLLLLFLGAVFLLPDIYWALLTFAVMLAGGWEWARLSGYSRKARGTYLLALAAFGLWLLSWGNAGAEGGTTPAFSSPVYLLIFGVAAAFWLLVAPVWLKFGWRVTHPLMLAVSGGLVLLPLWLSLVYLRDLGPRVLLSLLAVVWIADTAAYFAGKKFGRRKLAPAISPGKTWEGVLGALLGVTAFGAGLAGLSGMSPWLIAFFWGLVALSIEGDLFESWMKRQAGLKDSGDILPGHGGILDRVDGLTSSLPVAAFVLLSPISQWLPFVL
jgi:phosphatidate cytidylyltransferase